METDLGVMKASRLDEKLWGVKTGAQAEGGSYSVLRSGSQGETSKGDW